MEIIADIKDIQGASVVDIKPVVEEILANRLAFPKREYQGRGIVTASGCAERILQSLVSISMLREHGCTLPIELFYADSLEMEEKHRRMFDELSVTCINVQDSLLFQTYNARNFSIKAIALYCSSFAEAIWMDADIIPMIDVTDLFQCEHYQAHGYTFQLDIWSSGRNPNLFSYTLGQFFSQFNQKIQAGEPELDSGLFMFHKTRLAKALDILLLLNLNHAVTYKSMYGDKDTFKLSIKLTEGSFSSTDLAPLPIGKFFAHERLFCGNGVLFRRFDEEHRPFAVHMTLHSIDHLPRYPLLADIWDSYIPREIELLLKDVHPIAQALIPKYEYDCKWIRPLSKELQSTKESMYRYYNQYSVLM